MLKKLNSGAILTIGFSISMIILLIPLISLRSTAPAPVVTTVTQNESANHATEQPAQLAKGSNTAYGEIPLSCCANKDGNTVIINISND